MTTQGNGLMNAQDISPQYTGILVTGLGDELF